MAPHDGHEQIVLHIIDIDGKNGRPAQKKINVRIFLTCNIISCVFHILLDIPHIMATQIYTAYEFRIQDYFWV